MRSWGRGAGLLEHHLGVGNEGIAHLIQGQVVGVRAEGVLNLEACSTRAQELRPGSLNRVPGEYVCCDNGLAGLSESVSCFSGLIGSLVGSQ